MYKIKWRPYKSLRLITGLSTFQSAEQAQQQIDRWKSIWHNNSYYIVPIC